MIIQTRNNLPVNAFKTYLSGAINSGTTVLGWKNPNGFSASWAVQIGETGEQQAEIVLLSASTPAGTAGTTTANTLYDHPADTPLYAVKYDQVVFQRSTTGTAGVASPITNGTVTISPNGSVTTFDDTTGASTYAYNTYFRNSVLAVNSGTSSWITPAGFNFYSLAKMRQRVKDKLVNSSYITNDSMIDDWLNEWLEVMTNSAIDVDEGYQMGTTSVAYASGVELGTITATDFKQVRRVWYSDGSGTFQTSQMESNTFSPNKTFSTTYPFFYWEGDTVIGRKPSDLGAGTFTIEYYKLSPTLVNDTDQIPVNMQAYTKSFIDYAQGQALGKDSKPEQARDKLIEAQAGKELFKKEITPRNKTGALYVDIVEDTAADQELWQ